MILIAPHYAICYQARFVPGATMWGMRVLSCANTTEGCMTCPAHVWQPPPLPVPRSSS